MAEHTQGPWIQDPCEPHIIIPDSTDSEIGGMIAEVCGDNEEQWQANCNLIAAAPDLLAALEAFVEDVRVAYIGEQEPEMVDHSALMHEWPDLVRSFHIARAAIARAKGGQ